jgi:hypothetical protein
LQILVPKLVTTQSGRGRGKTWPCCEKKNSMLGRPFNCSLTRRETLIDPIPSAPLGRSPYTRRPPPALLSTLAAAGDNHSPPRPCLLRPRVCPFAFRAELSHGSGLLPCAMMLKKELFLFNPHPEML